MLIRQGLDDRQAEPGARGLVGRGVVRLSKGLEHLGKHRFLDADPIVLDSKGDAPLGGVVQGNQDFAAIR
jgi:hypothetical protein